MHLPVLRYVDDSIAAETEASIEHAMNVFAHLVRACLGAGSVAPHKLQHGNPLTVLGVDVHIKSDGAIVACVLFEC